MAATVLVVTSGKGGVGKTTSTASLGMALAQAGQKVVVIDFDVGLRNLDLVLGAERRVVFDLVNVVQGEAKLAQALIRDKRVELLSLLAASQTRDKDALSEEGVGKVIEELREKFDWIVCDSPAGIEKGAALAMRFADRALVVTNPEISSVRDSDRIIGLLDSKTARAERGDKMEKHLLLTRYDPVRAERGDMLKVDDVLDILAIPLIGIIPDSEEVLKRVQRGLAGGAQQPAISAPARAYAEAARRLMGETIEIVVPTEKKTLMGPPVRPEGCMNLLSFFRPKATAPVARERLQILLAHERALNGRPGLTNLLKDEILAVIARHFPIDRDKVSVKLDSSSGVSTLEIDIEMPDLAKSA